MIYIAGPLSSSDPGVVRDNIQIATEAYLELVSRRIHAFCPHMAGLVPGAFDLNYELWMHQCFETLRRSDGIWLLPGWRRSDGSMREYNLAQEIQIPAYYSLNDILLKRARPLRREK